MRAAELTLSSLVPSPVLIAQVAAFFLGLTAVGMAVGYTLEAAFSNRKIYNVPLAKGQTRFELRGNLNFLLVTITAFSLALASGAARFGEDTLGRQVGTFFALFFGFQAYYYPLHRALHTRSLVRFHRHHHESRVTTPLTGQSMSLVEAALWQVGYVALPIGLSWIVPISAWGWASYITFNVLGNIIGHANCEVVPPAPGLYWRSLVGTVFTYHSMHHARWRGHYAFASTWADRLFGTEWPDWMTLYARVWAGKPMTSLKERGDNRPGTPGSDEAYDEHG